MIIVVVNTGWHHKYRQRRVLRLFPGFDKAGEWLAAVLCVKAVGTDTQALTIRVGHGHRPARSRGRQQGGLLPWRYANSEAQTGRKVLDDFRLGNRYRAIPRRASTALKNVGGDLDKVTGKSVTRGVPVALRA